MLNAFVESDLNCTRKLDGTLVTDVDRHIETLVTNYLSEKFPEFGLLSEESGGSNLDCEYLWCVDPIDGTEAFYRGVAQFGTSMAVIHQSGNGLRRPIWGAIYLPIQDVLIWGNRQETWVNNIPTRFSSNRLFNDCLILGDISSLVRANIDVMSLLGGMEREFHTIQTWGDCLGYALLLDGKASCRIEAGLGIEDVAPLEPIILGAGGYISDWEGNSLSELVSKMPTLVAGRAEFNIICGSNIENCLKIVNSLSAAFPMK